MRADFDGHDLEALAARGRTGDPDAFAALVDRTHRTVYRLVLRMVETEADAADVVQEVYIRVWQGLPRLREPAAVLAWICRIARHLAADRVRRLRRMRTDSLDRPAGDGLDSVLDCIASDEPGPEQSMATAQLRAAVWHALGQLKHKHRLVLVLREVDGMSYEELAIAIGAPIGTIESRLHRARRELASKLERLLRKQAREAA